MKSFHQPALAFVIVSALSACPATADEARIRIVLFTPSDVEPPADVPGRMKQIIDYGQAFYSHWMQHWEYEPENALPVDRDADGNPIIAFVRGAETAASGAYDREGFQGQVREQAITQYKIPRNGSTWWIFVHGTKLQVSRGWGGFADKRGNGLTLLVWNDVAGDLSLDDPLAGGVADRLNLKGYLHELGHTMSLPHIGPNDRHGLGMSLMGPNARTYRRARSNREERVYLTPATAALIWKQPQMTGRYDAAVKLPRMEVVGLKAELDRRERRFVISGRLRTDAAAHSVVAIDIPSEGPGEYWKKGYASRLQPEGGFRLVIDELLPSPGVVKIVFCFDNGVFTGRGKSAGFRDAIEIPYAFSQNQHRLVD